ncbi:unnamed protein product [Gongylonema pulchrum]|uniref:EamA domain-containing protein n=1 Tax=Gongylonema pulchrum TaxID=637853 RepID=A0A183DVQ6_9BILA|nr:unnamed protein product [Gongylonema pulchrum]
MALVVRAYRTDHCTCAHFTLLTNPENKRTKVCFFDRRHCRRDHQVTYQLKILTTAFFSVALLGRRLNGMQWLSLILLTAGIALVQLAKTSSNVTLGAPTSFLRVDFDQMVGLLAVIAACFSSGFAGVYFEKVLKGTSVSLWMRNLQLAFFSIFGGFFMVWLYDSAKVNQHGFAASLSIIVSSIFSYWLLADFQPSL